MLPKSKDTLVAFSPPVAKGLWNFGWSPLPTLVKEVPTLPNEVAATVGWEFEAPKLKMELDVAGVGASVFPGAFPCPACVFSAAPKRGFDSWVPLPARAANPPKGFLGAMAGAFFSVSVPAVGLKRLAAKIDDAGCPFVKASAGFGADCSLDVAAGVGAVDEVDAKMFLVGLATLAANIELACGVPAADSSGAFVVNPVKGVFCFGGDLAPSAFAPKRVCD